MVLDTKIATRQSYGEALLELGKENGNSSRCGFIRSDQNSNIC